MAILEILSTGGAGEVGDVQDNREVEAALSVAKDLATAEKIVAKLNRLEGYRVTLTVVDPKAKPPGEGKIDLRDHHVYVASVSEDGKLRISGRVLIAHLDKDGKPDGKVIEGAKLEVHEATAKEREVIEAELRKNGKPGWSPNKDDRDFTALADFVKSGSDQLSETLVKDLEDSKREAIRKYGLTGVTEKSDWADIRHAAAAQKGLTDPDASWDDILVAQEQQDEVTVLQNALGAEVKVAEERQKTQQEDFAYLAGLQADRNNDMLKQGQERQQRLAAEEAALRGRGPRDV